MPQEVADQWLSEEQTEKMIAEYEETGTSTCPLCGTQTQPWGGLWACSNEKCGGITCKK